MSTANQTSEKVHTCVSTAFEQWWEQTSEQADEELCCLSAKLGFLAGATWATQAPAVKDELKPLTKRRLETVLQELAENIESYNIVMTHWPKVARAVERAHGIGVSDVQPKGTRVTGRELNRFSVHGANIYDHLDDADVLIRVDGDWESEADRDQYVNALAARLQAPAPAPGPMTDADVGALTYEGNTVSYIKEPAASHVTVQGSQS